MPDLDAGSRTDIDAPIETVFAVVADMELVPRWQPDVRLVECLERDAAGRAAVVFAELQTPIRSARARLRISYAEPTTVSWTLEQGDLKAFEGNWTLTDLGDGRTRAEYAVRIDFGRRLGLLLRGPAGKAMGGAAVSSMPDKLKAFVESGSTGAAHAEVAAVAGP